MDLSWLQPKSCFTEEEPKLDLFLRVRTLDRPKDTLAQLDHKRQLFLAYVGQGPEWASTEECRRREEFAQWGKEQSTEPMVLLVTVTTSRRCKCDIVARNLNGEVVKYYPHILASKKEGKLCKLLADHQNVVLLVQDKDVRQPELPVCVSMLARAHACCYSLSHLDSSQSNMRLSEKLAAHGIVRTKKDGVDIVSQTYLELEQKGIAQQIEARAKLILQQEDHFLNKIRGKREETQREVAFDAMALNLWRAFKIPPEEIVDLILKLFSSKAQSVQRRMVDEPSGQHRPRRMLTSQNCARCLAEDPNLPKPKRTFWICQGCSSAQDKPVYLCKNCLQKYHREPMLPTHRRHQKRSTRATRAIRRKTKPQTSVTRSQQPPELTHMQQLTYHSESFFARIDELLQDDKIERAEFYLTMLLNTAVSQAKQHFD